MSTSHTFLRKDCLEFLKEIPDESIDLALTDPPYNIGFDGGKKWDSQWKTEDDYLDWCQEWTKECVKEVTVQQSGRLQYLQ